MSQLTGPPTGSTGAGWWLRFWAGLAVAGGLLSPLVLGAGPAVITWVAGFAMAITVSGIVAPHQDPVDWRRAARSAVLCGAAFAATTAAVQVLGPAALLVPIAAALTSAPVVRGVRRRSGAWSGHAIPVPRPTEQDVVGRRTVDPTPPVHRLVHVDASPAALAAMDTARLCRAWRSSYLRIEAATSTAELVEVVRLRQALLDELHRRHLVEVRAWLAAGGRAASGPERFLGRATRTTR